MKNLFRILVAFGSAAVLAGCATDHKHSHADHKATAPESTSAQTDTASAVNTICPIGKEPIDATLVVQHGDASVAFCCQGCAEYWEGLDDEQKTEFVDLAREGKEMDFDA